LPRAGDAAMGRQLRTARWRSAGWPRGSTTSCAIPAATEDGTGEAIRVGPAA
jgi:hypothetical protein